MFYGAFVQNATFGSIGILCRLTKRIN